MGLAPIALGAGINTTDGYGRALGGVDGLVSNAINEDNARDDLCDTFVTGDTAGRTSLPQDPAGRASQERILAKRHP